MALLAYRAKAKVKTGELSISVEGFKSADADRMLAAILTANTTCPGLPKISKLLRGPFVAGGAGPGPLSASYVVEAEWAHDVLGPLKGTPLGCLERRLQAVTPGVRVTAERIS